MKASRSPSPPPDALMLEHSFSKGCHYENMKGSYEVLSIDGSTMRIQWENGEESVTELKLQDRILSRFEREVRAARARRLSTRQEEFEPQFGPGFRGLFPTDFTEDAAKTTWRSRTSGIGTAVTQELGVGEFCFGFWAPFRKPMIQWADVDQRTGAATPPQGGFFCRLDEERAHYGFFVERSSEADGRGNWHRFVDWVGSPEHDEWLRALVAANGLRITDSQTGASFLQASGSHWVWVEADGRSDVASVAEFLRNRPGEPGTRIECAVVVEKDRVVRRALKLGHDIAQVFELLMPLYRACLGVAWEPKVTRPARKRAAN